MLRVMGMILKNNDLFNPDVDMVPATGGGIGVPLRDHHAPSCSFTRCDLEARHVTMFFLSHASSSATG
jgi:hypothetical protein